MLDAFAGSWRLRARHAVPLLKIARPERLEGLTSEEVSYIEDGTTFGLPGTCGAIYHRWSVLTEVTHDAKDDDAVHDVARGAWNFARARSVLRRRPGRSLGRSNGLKNRRGITNGSR